MSRGLNAEVKGQQCGWKRNQSDWNLERSTGQTAVCPGAHPGARPETQDASEWAWTAQVLGVPEAGV